MHNIFVNKRIDSLGRIVIPKEIRKQMHIIENENLEISLENEKIIIKKSSTDIYDKKIFNDIIEIIKKDYNIDIDIYNTNSFIKNTFKDNLNITDLEKILKTISTTYKNYLIMPLIPNGIIYGGIIINKMELNNEIEKILNTIKNFIEKYLEE